MAAVKSFSLECLVQSAGEGLQRRSSLVDAEIQKRRIVEIGYVHHSRVYGVGVF